MFQDIDRNGLPPDPEDRRMSTERSSQRPSVLGADMTAEGNCTDPSIRTLSGKAYVWLSAAREITFGRSVITLPTVRMDPKPKRIDISDASDHEHKAFADPGKKSARLHSKESTCIEFMVTRSLN